MTNVAARSEADARFVTATARRVGIGLSLPLALGLLNFLLGLVAPDARLQDPDTMLHVVIGRWILAHHAVPHTDVFTYSVPGIPWVAHEWLGGIVSALLYAALGWHGLVAMAALGLATAVAIYTRALLRYYDPAHTIIIACFAWFVLTVHWLARPHILALPLLVLWTAFLVDARAKNRAPPLWTALLMVLWVNIHGTFLVGIGFMGMLAVEAVLLNQGEAARLKAAKEWALFSVVAIAATLVTPYGIEAYLLPFRLLHMKFALSILSEWKSIDWQSASPVEYWLVLFLAVALIRGIKLPVYRTFLVLLLFVMAMQHARNADFLAFMAPLLVGPAAGPQLSAGTYVGAGGNWLERFARPAQPRGWLIAGLAAALGVAVSLAFPLGPVKEYAPQKALDAAAAAGVTAEPVLNDYNFGDFLMFNGIKTFVDGRADMFGDDFLKKYHDAMTGWGSDLADMLKKYKVTWTLLATGSQAAGLMDHMPGWHRLYGDKTALVYVRNSVSAAPPR